MNLELLKFKILCINIFITLYKAATLNPYKLQNELKVVNYTLHSNCDLCHHVLVLVISLYLEIKFVIGYITLAANVVALFPILTDDLPHLLLPALIAQTIDNIALNFSEIILGFVTIKTVAVGKMSILIILASNKLFKIIFAIAALNIYSDYYQYIKFKPLKIKFTESMIPEEKFIRLQTLQ